MVKLDHSPAFSQVVRYGLPLVILIFYISATWNFSYTPDSTFLSLRLTRDLSVQGTLESLPAHPESTPNPLWVFFLSLSTLLKLDSLLAAKIFSLFFSCLGVLLVYLVASEILQDRLLAFCASLAVATNGVFLQMAPAGSALPLAIVLVMAALFFMLRDDYLLSAIMLGLATLVFWQAVGGLVLLLSDAWLGAASRRLRLRKVLLVLLLYLCTVTPWILFAAFRAAPPIPWLVGLGDFPGLYMATGVAVAIPAVVAGLACIGVLTRRQSDDGLSRQRHLIVIFWACWFLACFGFRDWTAWVFTLPLVIIYAFVAVQQRALLPHSAAAYTQGLILTGILIFLHQVAFNASARPLMVQTEKDSEELVELAYWIKNGVPDEASVGARRPELLAYYAQRPVESVDPAGRPSTEYLVSEKEEVWGYDLVYRASRVVEGELLPGAGHFAVWKKK